MARNHFAAALAVMSLILGACGGATVTPTVSSTVIPSASPGSVPTASPSVPPMVEGCVPECLPHVGAPVRFVPPGRFMTKYFFAGAFTIDLDDGWTVEDGSNELAFEHRGPPDWFIFAWIDPYPLVNLHRVEGVERTPEALIASLRSNPTLIATPVPATTVAGGIPAAAIDLRVSNKATREFPDCPDICTNYLGFENGPDAHGIARPGMTRLYFAQITYGGQVHLLTIAFETNDEATFAPQLSHAKQLIDSIRMPVLAAR